MDAPLALPGTWHVDHARSTVGWSVKHLGVTTVPGAFTTFAGELQDGHATGTVAAASVLTDDEQRDRFVRSEQFLDTDGFPELRFDASVVAGEPAIFDGNLTIRETTLPVTLTVENMDAANGEVTLRLRGAVRRRPYGLRFPQAMGAADHSVSDEVQLMLDLVLVPAR